MSDEGRQPVGAPARHGEEGARPAEEYCAEKGGDGRCGGGDAPQVLQRVLWEGFIPAEGRFSFLPTRWEIEHVR